MRRRGRNTLALVIAVTAAFLLLGLSVEAGHEGTKSWLASRAAGSHRRLLQDGSSEFLLPSALASGSSAPPPPPGAKHFSGVQKVRRSSRGHLGARCYCAGAARHAPR